jgi:multicomponent Na+:H+ antiporter subunit E
VPVIVWLSLVWVALWGDLSVQTVLMGVVVAVVVCVVFPLPPLGLRLRPQPLWMTWLAIRFLSDLVVASADVSWKTLTGRRPRNAVIEVDLRTRSDLVLTIVAEMVSLVPGSLVVEARRSTHTIFLHVFDARDAAGADRMRTQVLALEQRVARAFGGDALALTSGDRR